MLGVPSRCSLNMVNSLGLQLVVGKLTSFDVRQGYLSARPVTVRCESRHG